MSDKPIAQHPSAPTGTRHLVAEELLPALDMLPAFDFNAELLAFIRGGGGREMGLKPPTHSPAQQAVVCAVHLAPGPPGAPNVRVLLYTPPGVPTAPRPAFLHFHGGGFVIGTPELNDGSNRMLAADLGCVVASVDYRLAPETRFPGALEDGYAALAWLHAEAETLGVDRARIAIGGESAGASHAARLAILARDRGEFPICLQLLDSPALDDRTGSVAEPHPFCGEFVWTASSNRFGWSALLGVDAGSAEVPTDAVPARIGDLSGLAPCFIAVGALDLFLEESIEYASRLIRAGVPTELHVIPGAFHGFAVVGGDAPQVVALHQWRRDALARAFRK
jgi:acetyl esterase/lipase